MDLICVKLRLRGSQNKYRRILSTDEKIFSSIDDLVIDTVPYSPITLISDDTWFKIENMSNQPYTIDIVTDFGESVDFDSLSPLEFDKIDFLFVKRDDAIFFQNITHAKLVSKKCIWELGENYCFQDKSHRIVINEKPDAVYCQINDTLFFRRLESITTIFRGIDQLFREATLEETAQFLESDFIQIGGNYSAQNVKTANRKRIALASTTLSQLSVDERRHIFTYIGDYCPNLKTQNGKFAVESEEALKMVLYGIEQRFYTTPVGNEQRIANSVISFSQQNGR